MNRLSPQTVRVFSKKDGLREDNIYPILEDRAGAIWLGAWQQSLIRYESGVFKTLLDDSEIPYYSSLFEDRDGKIWFGNTNGVFYLDNGKPVEFTDQTGFATPTIFNVIAQNKDDNFWFGTNKGLSRVRDGETKVYTVADGLPDNFVVAFLQARDGKIWIGTSGGVAALDLGFGIWDLGFGISFERRPISNPKSQIPNPKSHRARRVG